jgi:hypothetical protein
MRPANPRKARRGAPNERKLAPMSDTPIYDRLVLKYQRRRWATLRRMFRVAR